MIRPSLLLPLAALAADISSAQTSIYVDFSETFTGWAPPAPSYAAAAGVPGTWNDFLSDTFSPATLTQTALLDRTGATTAVSLEVTTPNGIGLFGFRGGNSLTTGDDELLLDDLISSGETTLFTFMGLAPATYDVITYCIDPSSSPDRTSVDVFGSTSGLQVINGTFQGGFQVGESHALHRVAVDGTGMLVIETNTIDIFDSINGIQLVPAGSVPLGDSYCTAAINSTGAGAAITATGSPFVTDASATLHASAMPPGQFGIFVTSRTQDFIPSVGDGNLCLGSPLGRFSAPGQIRQADSSGRFSMALDLTAIPEGAASTAVVPGDTWNFQAWFRDVTSSQPPAATSSLTDGVSITFM